MRFKFLFLSLAGCLVFSLAPFLASAAEPALLHSSLNAPVGIIHDGDGVLHVAAWGDGTVTRIMPDGRRQNIASGLDHPAGLAFDNAGTLYIAGYGDGVIYHVDHNAIKPFASGLSAPTGMLWSKDNSLLVANRNAGEIVKIYPDGRRQTISAGHNLPVGIAQTADGSLFISCYGGSIDVISPNGSVKSLSVDMATPGVGIIANGSDGVLVVDYGRGSVVKVGSDGKSSIVAEGLKSPVGLTKQPDGKILVGCWGDNSIHELDPN